MKISIIVPVYNTELYLENCINSILNQTYENLEIILVNDGSKDKSGLICDKYAKIDNRIIVIHKENGGVSSARNVGINLSTGDYIVFIDSDDWVECNMIKTLVKIIEKNDYDVIMFGAYIEDLEHQRVDEFRVKTEDYKDKNEIMSIIPELIREEKINSLWTKIYKASIIQEKNIRFNEELSIAEDGLFNYEIFKHIKSFCTINNLLYHYMIRNVISLTKRYNPSKYEMLLFVNDYLHSNINKGFFNSNVLSAAQYIRVKNIYSCLLDMFNKKYLLTLNEKKMYIRRITLKQDIKHSRKLGNNKFGLLSWVLSTRNEHIVFLVTFLISKIRK